MRAPTRSPYVFTEARLRLWAKEGRGQGEGADYRPWLQCRNVKSRGRKHRLRGILHDRVLHVMSDLERNALLFFERQPQVLDVREQFPLDRDVTREIARAMGVRHPADPVTNVDIVMTTDLLVTFMGKGCLPVARAFSVKEASDMLKPRTVVKQEIERRYWERFGYGWQPLLDTELRRAGYFNAVLWAREWFYLPVAGTPKGVWRQRCQRVIAALAARRDDDLGTLVRRLEAQGGFGAGEVLSTLRHLVARQAVDYAFAEGTPTLDTPLTLFGLRAAVARQVA